jgi:hypothetical protein
MITEYVKTIAEKFNVKVTNVNKVNGLMELTIYGSICNLYDYLNFYYRGQFDESEMDFWLKMDEDNNYYIKVDVSL